MPPQKQYIDKHLFKLSVKSVGYYLRLNKLCSPELVFLESFFYYNPFVPFDESFRSIHQILQKPKISRLSVDHKYLMTSQITIASAHVKGSDARVGVAYCALDQAGLEVESLQ